MSTKTLPVVSQLRSLWQLCTGDPEGALETWDTFIDAWTNHPGDEISSIANGVPVVGHIKGAVHFAMGDIEEGIRAEEAATRSMVVLGAGALTVATGGAGAPVLAGVVAGVGAGLVYDAATTGIESARHGKYDPQGYLALAQEAVHDVRGATFDFVALASGDAFMGKSTVTKAAGTRNTVKVYRVEGESFWNNKGVIKSETSRRLFPTDDEGVIASSRPSRIFPDDTTAQGSRETKLFLNFGQPKRAGQFYSQRMLDHRTAVELLASEGTRPTALSHTLQIKSFRIMTRDLKDIQRRAVPERGSRSNPNNQGIIEVDITKAPNQYACNSRTYMPLLQNAIRGSYKEYTPWFSELPSSLLQKFKDKPIAYGHVRTAIIGFTTFSKLSLDSLVANRIQNEEDLSSLKNTPYPLSQLSEHGTGQIEVKDEPVLGIRHVRLAKCGRRTTREVDHGQHMEYLVEFADSSLQWLPSLQVAPDLVKEFEELSMRNAQEVTAILETQGDKQKIQRLDGTTDTINQTQIFWLEEEPGDVPQLSRQELDALLYHANYGPDNDVYTPATLTTTSDWAKVEVLTPGTLIRRDESVDKSIYADTVFTPTSVMWRQPVGHDSRNRTIRYFIVNNGASIDIKVSCGKDSKFTKLLSGRAQVTFQEKTYSMKSSGSSDNAVFKNCVVNHSLIHTPITLHMRTDWAEVKLLGSDAHFLPEPSFDSKIYKNVSIQGDTIVWGKQGSRQYQNDELPFVIAHAGTSPTVSIQTSRGPDSAKFGDRIGRVAVSFKEWVYVNDDPIDEQVVNKTFENCPLRLPPPLFPPSALMAPGSNYSGTSNFGLSFNSTPMLSS